MSPWATCYPRAAGSALHVPTTFVLKISSTMMSEMKNLNIFHIVIYWTQMVHNDFIFLCSIALPPVGHLFKPSVSLLKLTRQSSCISNFYRIFKVLKSPSCMYIYIYTLTYIHIYPPSSCMLHVRTISSIYEGELHENLKLHVASGAAIFTLLLHRRVSFPHLTATCRTLFKPWVSLLSTYRQSSCGSNFYRTF